MNLPCYAIGSTMKYQTGKLFFYSNLILIWFHCQYRLPSLSTRFKNEHTRLKSKIKNNTNIIRRLANQPKWTGCEIYWNFIALQMQNHNNNNANRNVRLAKMRKQTNVKKGLSSPITLKCIRCFNGPELCTIAIYWCIPNKYPIISILYTNRLLWPQ